MGPRRSARSVPPEQFANNPRRRRLDLGRFSGSHHTRATRFQKVALLRVSFHAPDLLSGEESGRMADHTPYQRKIIDRYYKNFDAIAFQRLSELATELYLAEGKKRDRLWKRVEESLRKLEFPEVRIALLLEKGDPALLVEILKELENK
jgi:hypothetical protein